MRRWLAAVSIIVTPGAASNLDCWVWLAPPQMVRKAVENFQAEAALAIPASAEGASELSLELLQGVRIGNFETEISREQAEPFHIETGKITLSRDAALKLLAPEKLDPARLVVTGASADRSLARAWLVELAELKARREGANAWKIDEAREAWARAFDGPEAPAPLTKRERAVRLFKLLTPGNAPAETGIYEAFGATRTGERLGRLELEIALQLENYEVVFQAWGDCAGSLRAFGMLLAQAKTAGGRRTVDSMLELERARLYMIEGLLRRALALPGESLIVQSPAIEARR